MNNILSTDCLNSPLGTIQICATAQGVCLIEFLEQKNLATELKDLEQKLQARPQNDPNHPHLMQAKAELTAYFAGTLTHFHTPLHIIGTEFQQKAWHILTQIPYGQTISYQQQAQLLGNARAVRAVGCANGKNKISIIVPCHRVIGRNGNLTGYAGGLDRKKWLLDWESQYSHT